MATSGCTHMGAHGTRGSVTSGLGHGLMNQRDTGKRCIEVPAGVIDIDYKAEGDRGRSVRGRNVTSYLARRGIEIEVPGFGPLTLDVAYGGNFYAIIEPQGPYKGLDALGTARIVDLSRALR